MQAVADKNLIPYIKKCLDETQIDPSQLALEIPEAALNFDSLNLSQTTEALRKLGCPVIIDGYGSSFAAFQRLKQVDCDELKLDSKLIENLAEDELNQHLVRAALEIAKGLHLRTTAKNVTDAQTLKLLHAYGVDRVQGFYIGAPSNTIDQWLTQQGVAQPDLQ
jgi:EAL domain-containing protein (putative c-di-GMP-specific phosphodiesterase class I)